MLFVIIGRDGPEGAAKRPSVRPAHLAHLRPLSGDVYYPYRQDSDFDYLTGLGEPECVAVLAPGHKDPFALFVRPHDPERAIWVGARVGLDGAVDAHGAIVAHPIDDLEKELPRWLRTSDRVFLDLSRQDAMMQRLHAIVRRVQAERPRLGSG